MFIEEQAPGLTIQWNATLKSYMTSLLTKATDRLPALSEIAKQFALRHSFQKTDYLAGMWRHDLLQSLPWFVRNPWGVVKPVAMRAESYMAPTWSWASVIPLYGTHIELAAQFYEAAIFDIVIVEAVVEPVADNYGQLRSGHLLLQTGPLVKILSSQVAYIFMGRER
jgi:hypothetical protein